jgi:hypothetical protein
VEDKVKLQQQIEEDQQALVEAEERRGWVAARRALLARQRFLQQQLEELRSYGLDETLVRQRKRMGSR